MASFNAAAIPTIAPTSVSPVIVTVWPFTDQLPSIAESYDSGYAQGLDDADTTTAYNNGYAAGFAAAYDAALGFYLAQAVESAEEIEVEDQATSINHVSEALARLATQYGDDVNE